MRKMSDIDLKDGDKIVEIFYNHKTSYFVDRGKFGRLGLTFNQFKKITNGQKFEFIEGKFNKNLYTYRKINHVKKLTRG